MLTLSKEAGAFEALLTLYLINVIFFEEAGVFDSLLILLDANTFQKAGAFEALLIPYLMMQCFPKKLVSLMPC